MRSSIPVTIASENIAVSQAALLHPPLWLEGEALGVRLRTRFGDRVDLGDDCKSYSIAVTEGSVFARHRSALSIDRAAGVSAGADLSGNRTEQIQNILLNDVLDRVDSHGSIRKVYGNLQ